MARKSIMADLADGEELTLKSPLSAKAVPDEAVKLQLQQFFDDWHFRFMSSSLGRTWNRHKVVGSALDILTLNGCDIDAADREKLIHADEALMIEEIVDRMPHTLREGFDHFCLQLQMVMQMVTRVRTSLDTPGGVDPISCVIEEIDTTHIGQQLMQMAVVTASKEVQNIKRCQQTWIADTEKRVERLHASAEKAQHAQQQLLAVEAQLETLNADKKSKSKQLLVNMAEGSEKALTATVFSTWLGYQLKVKAEAGIRKKFTDEIERLENTLIEYKEKQLTNVRNHFMRTAKEGQDGLIGWIFGLWKAEVAIRKRDGDTAAEMKKLQEKLAQSKGDQAAKTTATLTRMCGARDNVLMTLVFQGWMKFHEDYQKDKAFEDQVKKTEKLLREQMDEAKGKRKDVLNRLSSGNDTGLLAMTMGAWVKMYLEAKDLEKLESAMGGNEGKFKNLQSRQLGNARGVQGRVNEQMKANLLLRCFCFWQIDTKVASIDRHYTVKVDNKRRQLQGVQTLFKSFSQQLEQGLGNVDGDSSGRTSVKHRSRRDMSKVESLPDIHSRPVVA